MLVLFDQITPVTPEALTKKRRTPKESILPANAVLGFETEADAKIAARLIKKAHTRSADEKSGAEAPHSKRVNPTSERRAWV